MTEPSISLDGWRPPWRSFADLLASGDGSSRYLTALDHELGERQEWTRGQWRAGVAGTASALARRGLRPGDTVAVLAGNDAEALVLAFACWASGFCYLPLNAHEPLERQRFILEDAEARVLIHAEAHGDSAKSLGEQTHIATAPFDEVVGGAADELPHASADLSYAALRVYTSGTTGEPKGVVLSVENLLTDADALAQVMGWNDRTRVLVVLPIHHVNGLVLSSLVSWYTGASAVLCDRFRSDRFWDDVDTEAATVCSMVPTLLEFLLSEGGGSAPSHFREVLCGAGPLRPDTVTEFEERFGVPVRHLYGLSETTAVATMMPTLPDEVRRRWYVDHGFPSVGPAVPHVEVAVHDRDGRPCQPGERGEIVIRGATVMAGYAGRPDATAEALRGGWFHSGDEGFWRPDEEGRPFLFVTGRLKELIIRGGVNISPFEIDQVLCQHPAVRFGLALPFEHRYYGEEIAAYVVSSEPVSEQEILDFCAERLDHAYQPKVVIFGEDVPFTATGKAKRLALRNSLSERLAEFRDVQFRRRQPDAVTVTPDVHGEDL